jgi:cytochrome P450
LYTIDRRGGGAAAGGWVRGAALIGAQPTLRALTGQDPYPRYEEIRRQARVFWDPGMRAWLVTGFEDCAFVEKREDLFAATTGNLPSSEEIGGRRGILTIDGEAHKALHKHVTRYLTDPGRIAAWRAGFIRPLIDRLVDDFVGRGRAETGTELADHVPISVVGSVLGLPVDDLALLAECKQWMNDVLAWRHTYGEVPEIVERARARTHQLEAFLLPVVRARRAQPRDDLLSELWRVGPSVFPDWGDDDVLAQCKVLFEAGTETTTHLICTLTYLLVTRDELRRRLLADREALIPRFVEEALRILSPVHLRVRAATRDVELGGVLIKKGDRVHPINAAANRDPERYRDPGEIDLERPAFRSHLAFNVGPRHCVGAALARAEACEAVDALLTRLRNQRLDPDAEPPRLVGFVTRSFRPLHLLFDPT